MTKCGIISDLTDDLAFSRRRTLTLGRLRLPWPFPLGYALGSSLAMVLGTPVYGTDAPWHVRALHRVLRRLEDAKYWLYYRMHPAHRYHLVDTGLGYGYHERDERFLNSAMACLVGYVQDCEASGVHDPGDEARAIVKWWRVGRVADRARVDQLMSELYSGKSRMRTIPVEGQPNLSQIVFDESSQEEEAKQKEMWALEEKMHADEQSYLHRLVDIRPGMWT